MQRSGKRRRRRKDGWWTTARRLVACRGMSSQVRCCVCLREVPSKRTEACGGLSTMDGLTASSLATFASVSISLPRFSAHGKSLHSRYLHLHGEHLHELDSVCQAPCSAPMGAAIHMTFGAVDGRRTCSSLARHGRTAGLNPSAGLVTKKQR